MNGLKIFLLILILIVVILGGWFHQTGLTVEYTVLSSSYYSGMLTESGLIENLHSAIQREVVSEMTGQAPTEVVLLISEAVFSVFDPPWLEEQITMVIDDGLRFIRGEQQGFDAVIELEEKKAELKTRMLAMIAMLPRDVLEQADIEPGAETLFVREIIDQLDLPDQFRLVDLLEEESAAYEMAEFSRSVQQFRLFYLYLPFVVFILLLVFNLLLAGGPGGLKWFGAGLFTSGITFLLGLQLTRFAASGPLVSSLSPEEMPFAEAVIAAAAYTVNRASMVPVVYAFTGLFFILAGIVLGVLVRKKKAKDYYYASRAIPFSGFKGKQISR